jgi:hypothetical protein
MYQAMKLCSTIFDSNLILFFLNTEILSKLSKPNYWAFLKFEIM